MYRTPLISALTPEPNEIDIEKIIARNIEEDNIRYKDRIFGNPFCGLAISIAPIKDEYEIGEEIEISTLFKNFSKEELELRIDNGIKDRQYVLYFSDGYPVPKSEFVEGYEASIKKPRSLPRTGSTQIYNLKPRQILQFNDKVSRFFKIEKEGTYYLIIMRGFARSWDDGFMISNMTKINIVNKKE
jgi:hypothetical protein